MKRCRSSIKIKTWVRKLLVWIINDKLLTTSGYKKFQRGILSLTDIYCNVVRDILTPYNLTHYNSYDGFHLSFVLMKTWCQIEQEVYICLLSIDFNNHCVLLKTHKMLQHCVFCAFLFLYFYIYIHIKVIIANFLLKVMKQRMYGTQKGDVG